MYYWLNMALTAIFLIICVYTDQKRGKILNKITFPTMLIGLLLSLLLGGIPGIKQSLQGIGLGLILFLLPFALGMLGAGDVKYLMAIGALTGPEVVARGFLYGSICGGVLSIVVMLQRGILISTLKSIFIFLLMNMYRLLFIRRGSVGGGTKELIGINDKGRAFPYSLPIAIGVLIAILPKFIRP